MSLASENRAKSRILLVEDSRVEARTTKDSLERAGYDVEWVEDGRSAIKIAKTKPIDVILLDLVLPDISGREVCRYLRKSRNTNGIPIIMLTVKDKVTDRVAGLAAGADDYLPKPYSYLELNARIYACLRTKALRDELEKKNKQMAAVLERAKLLADTDPLTNLFNRRSFEVILEHEFRQVVRFPFPLSCLMIDIDHFKRVNDMYGHRAGDTVLVQTARIFKSALRRSDAAARWGGEEFLILLPQTENAGAVKVAQKLLKKVSVHRFSGLPDESITVSIGVAGLPDPCINSGESLVNAADRAMYEAKRRGRNTVVSTQAGVME
ncbi:MAG: diguanylate cyclase [Nitrospirae bacterium]|nr:diguanylate cyclase [Nitrospirota bacterium]